MRNLQKAGGVSALVSAASYVFAIGLYLTLMMPLADSNLGIDGYMAFFMPHKSLAFVWTFSMYLVHGASLVVLVLALHERLKDTSPRLSIIAAGFGFIWAAFVLLSGFINIWGNEALITLYGKSREQAEALKNALTIITLGIDSSDRFLGSLWVGLVSLAAFRTKAFPKAFNIFGLALGAAALMIGLILPVNDTSASFLFGVGAIVWWLALGISMLRKQDIMPATSA
ncbi:MAG: hypothetical protein NT061_07005 [Spirochaetes bacterium]|nr:hypothetical protein [Spirochaetota bacterium]